MCEILQTIFADLIAFTRCDSRPGDRQRLLELHKAQNICVRQATITLQALSPIQWVPNEILAEIFFHCIPSNYHFSQNEAPLSLCRVCKVWRTLVLSNHGLWRKLSFWSPPATKRDLLCYPLRLVNRWLSHSGTLPLHLFFENGMSRTHVKTFAELVLLEYYPRCQHLDFGVSRMPSLGLINFINLPPGSLEALECLVLDGMDEEVFEEENDDYGDDDDDDDTSPPIMITAFQSSRRLRKLATSSLDFAFYVGPDEIRFNLLVVPWPQLTDLLITDFINIDFFIHMLTECLALKFLRVSLGLTNSSRELSHICHTNLPKDVVLPSLTDLYISVDGGSSFPSEMDIFSFPALTAVHFRRYRNDAHEAEQFSWTESPHFCNQLGRLHHLILTGHVGPTEQVIFLLRCTPIVTKLSLDIFTDYAMLLPALFPSDQISLLPILTSLQLDLEHPELCYPQCALEDVFEVTRNGVRLRRMRDISLECLQPCIFRLREMIESTQSSLLRSLRLVYLNGPPNDKGLSELRKQFKTSTLATQFQKKVLSSRVGSDQALIENHCTSTSYNLY